MFIYRDELIPAYKEITDAVHAEGSNIIMQLVHGSSTSQANPEKSKILGPSAVRNPFSGIVPQEMTEEDIKAVPVLFAQAALRAKKAGFDGVQIHAGHSCLLSQFLSPAFNRRTDSYGGSRENRYRLVGEVYRAIREAVGKNYPIWIKLDSEDGFENGLTTEDFLFNGYNLSKAGMNAIEVTGLVYPRIYSGAYYRKAAGLLTGIVDASVIVTGGIRTLSDVQSLYDENGIKFFGMSRPFMADANYLERMKWDKNLR